MNIPGSAKPLSSEELNKIIENSFRILGEIGVLVQNDELINLLRNAGAEVNSGSRRVKFSRKFIENFLNGASENYDEIDGLEVSCLLPYGKRAIYSHGVECTAGTYPQMYMDFDGNIRPHTEKTVSDMTRLADYLPNIDRIGVMGVPSDIPAAPASLLHMRLCAWKYAQNKLSGCGEVHNKSFIPYIIEMGKIMADYKNAPLRRYAFAEVELISPLRFMEAEAAVFVEMWKNNLLCGVGFMHSAGGSSPVTLAATVSLALCESIFVSILYRLCFGFKKLWFQLNASVLDMKSAMFPFGRPERGIMALAMGQIADKFNAGLWASGIFADAKSPSCEAGMQAAFTMTPAVMAGSLGLECFGLLSGAEIGSPVQLVIDNEFAGGIKRFARGFEVNENTLAYDVIKEEAESGFFTGHEHTVEHFRTEHWAPEFFSRETLSAWNKPGKKTDTVFAREIAEKVFKEYWPQNITDDVERELRKVIKSAEKQML